MPSFKATNIYVSNDLCVSGSAFVKDIVVNGNTYLSGSVSEFTATGSAKFNAGLSGSLTRLVNGKSFIEAGNNLTVTSASNGAITIGLILTGSFAVPGDLSVAGNTYLSGSVSEFTATGSAKFNAGLSGSLTRLTNGKSFIEEGSNIAIVSSSNGGITVNAQVTLDRAYDGTGNGAGAIVVVDNQPVQLRVAGANSVALSVTGSAIFASGSWAGPLPADTKFYVSGAMGGKGISGTSVFGGDAVVSGTLYHWISGSSSWPIYLMSMPYYPIPSTQAGAHNITVWNSGQSGLNARTIINWTTSVASAQSGSVLWQFLSPPIVNSVSLVTIDYDFMVANTSSGNAYAIITMANQNGALSNFTISSGGPTAWTSYSATGTLLVAPNTLCGVLISVFASGSATGSLANMKYIL